MSLESRMWAYLDALRSKGMSSNDYLRAITLVAETKKEYEKVPDKATEVNVYETMLAIADSMGERNPFVNSKEFYSTYTVLDQMDGVDWEKALQMLDGSNSDLMHVPKVIIDKYEEHFQPETESVLITEGEKFTPYLKQLVDKYSYCEYTITCRNELYRHILCRIFEGYRNVNVVCTSIYQYGFLCEKYDLILSVPAFGGRNLTSNKDFMCRELDLAATENLLLHLTTEGELLIVLPARITFASGNVSNLRNFILQMYRLVEIAELPAGIFAGTGIQTYFFVIGGDKVDSIDDVTIRKYKADHIPSKVRPVNELILDNETFVMVSELEEQGDWNLNKLFASQDQDWQRFMGTKKAFLKDVAEVFRGKAVSKKDANGNYGVVNISNLRDYDIDYDNLDHLDELERKVANYVLEPGDVLLPARGTALRTAVFEEQSYPCIASSNIIVIRPKEKELSGMYLKIFLDSPLGGKVLSATQQGTAVMNISYKDLMNVEIPLPDIEEQIRIADEYVEELRIYQETISAAEERWQKIRDKLQNEL